MEFDKRKFMNFITCYNSMERNETLEQKKDKDYWNYIVLTYKIYMVNINIKF